MTTALTKAAPLALLMLFPSLAPAQAGDSPRAARDKADKVIVVNDDPILLDDDEDQSFALESRDDEGPVIVQSHRDSRRGFLGVQLIDITEDLRAHFGAPRDAGVLVGEVEKDSPAAKAGLAVGDVVTRIDGDRMESAGDVSRAIRRRKGGDTVKIELERGQTAKTVSVTLEERKGRRIEIGDLGDLPGRIRERIRIPDLEVRIPKMGHLDLEGLGRLQEKLDALDKRLRDLEKKVH